VIFAFHFGKYQLFKCTLYVEYSLSPSSQHNSTYGCGKKSSWQVSYKILIKLHLNHLLFPIKIRYNWLYFLLNVTEACYVTSCKTTWQWCIKRRTTQIKSFLTRRCILVVFSADFRPISAQFSTCNNFLLKQTGWRRAVLQDLYHLGRKLSNKPTLTTNVIKTKSRLSELSADD